MSEEKSEFPKKGSSGSGETPCYSVEARSLYHEPVQIGDRIYHKEWRRVHFDKAPIGIPAGNLLSDKAKKRGLLDYAAAQALRWWFHAELEHRHGCFETRIVKHIVRHSYEEQAIGAFDYIGGESRNAVRPDV